ncbi:MAG: hypothetical protein JW894_10395 [Bacteroidales bacterium]|nr:hypothetical protein [Bacteroidales bacterium]
MNAKAVIIAILLLTTTISFAKKNAVIVQDTYYGVGLSQVNNGSGHGIGYTINANLAKGRKLLEVGLIYSERESKISGGDIKYRIMLGNIYRLKDQDKLYTPYLQYNLMYQKGLSVSSEVVYLGGEEYEVPSDPGTVATMGHYLAYGNKIRLFGRSYLDASVGLGYYIGSVDKADGPDTWGVHSTNGGLTYSFKVGFGYTFN